MNLQEGVTVLYHGDPVVLVEPYPNTLDNQSGRWVIDCGPTRYEAPYNRDRRVIWVEDMRDTEGRHIGHPSNVYYWPEGAYAQ